MRASVRVGAVATTLVLVLLLLAVACVRADLTVLPVPEVHDGMLVTGETLTIQVVGPTGTVVAYADVLAPATWVLCDGAQYPTATHGDLDAVLQGRFNTGGETPGHFRVPDLRGALPIGLDATKAPLDTLGESTAAGETTGANTLGFMAFSYIIKV
jgi:hypothetical protein